MFKTVENFSDYLNSHDNCNIVQICLEKKNHFCLVSEFHIYWVIQKLCYCHCYLSIVDDDDNVRKIIIPYKLLPFHDTLRNAGIFEETSFRIKKKKKLRITRWIKYKRDFFNLTSVEIKKKKLEDQVKHTNNQQLWFISESFLKRIQNCIKLFWEQQSYTVKEWVLKKITDINIKIGQIKFHHLDTEGSMKPVGKINRSRNWKKSKKTPIARTYRKNVKKGSKKN